MNKKVVIAGSPNDQSEIDTWLAYFKDQHDVVLDYPNFRAEFWINHFADQPLDDPQFERLRNYKKEIPTMYREHYHHLKNADLFFLLNHSQKGYQGYISPIDYADLKYLIVQNLLHDKKTKLYLLHTPSKDLPYYAELNYWLSMGWWNVIIIDMINEYLDPKGKLYCQAGRDIIPNIQKLKQAFQQSGDPIIYVNTSHIDDPDPEIKKWGMHALRGTWGEEIVPALLREAGDIIIYKRMYDGFYNTELDITLRSLAVKRVVITGIHTHICVLCTSLGAFYRGYDVIN